MTTPVTLLTGFLGSGKTTLLNRILRGDHGLRIGVLVNDFGDINIDARLVDSMDGQAIDLSNGCVCCTMQGDLGTSVRKLLARARPPQHILVEASGISDPIGMVQVFRTPALRERTQVAAVVTLVDAEHGREARLDRELMENQIRAADVIVLNKADLVGPERLADLEGWVRGLVPAARVLPAVEADVPIDLILAAGPHDGMTGSRQAVSAAGYTAWEYHTPRRLAYRAVRAAVADVPPDVFRGKGFLHLADAPNLRFLLQMVGKRVSIEVDRPWGSERPETALVFIGRVGAMRQDDLIARLDATASDALPLLPVELMRVLRSRAARSLIAPLFAPP